jgi:hypothetical protein
MTWQQGGGHMSSICETTRGWKLNFFHSSRFAFQTVLEFKVEKWTFTFRVEKCAIFLCYDPHTWLIIRSGCGYQPHMMLPLQVIFIFWRCLWNWILDADQKHTIISFHYVHYPLLLMSNKQVLFSIWCLSEHQAPTNKNTLSKCTKTV